MSSNKSPLHALLLGLVLSLSPTLVIPSSPANGDLRLVNSNGSRLHGVLYIYLDDQWGTVSYEGFTISAANVACRQLGLVGAESYRSTSAAQNSDTLLPDNVFGSGSTPVLLKDVSCRSNQSLHLLRCDSNSTITSHDHSNDVLLHCRPRNITKHPFRGQLYLSGSNYTSQGLLHVFINGEWGTVCGDFYKQTEADSSCRQLGYTGARNYSDHAFGRGIIWLKDFSCNQSQPCLTECYVSPTIRDISCRHSQDVYLYCTFDRSHSFETSGNETTCEIVISDVPAWVTWVCFTFFLSVGIAYVTIVVLRLLTAAYHDTPRYRRQNTQDKQQTQNLIT